MTLGSVLPPHTPVPRAQPGALTGALELSSYLPVLQLSYPNLR